MRLAALQCGKPQVYRERFFFGFARLSLAWCGDAASVRQASPRWTAAGHFESHIRASARGSVTSAVVDATLSSPYLLRMAVDHKSLSLRPVAAGDEEFLFVVYAGSRGDDLRGLGWDEGRITDFLRMQYVAQHRFLESEYHRADDQVVLMNGDGIGRVLVERRDDEIRGIDVALLPEFRNQGIGTWLITQLQLEATSARKPLRIQVIRFSPAVKLLVRLGFSRTGETGTHYQMEWQADS